MNKSMNKRKNKNIKIDKNNENYKIKNVFLIVFHLVQKNPQIIIKY